MDFMQIVMVTLFISHVVTKSRNKKKYETSSSDETIENLLYFKDCQRKSKDQPTTPGITQIRLEAPPPPPPPPPPHPECPFPKMCCALSCGNECGGSKEPSFMSRQMEPIQSIQPIQPMMNPRQPIIPVQPSIRKRKKMKFGPSKMQPPIGGRRDFGFTKAKIKSLISQDDDIRKILKDLVRVTMQKVDLMEMINGSNSRRNGGGPIETTESINPTSPAAYDDYDE